MIFLLPSRIRIAPQWRLLSLCLSLSLVVGCKTARLTDPVTGAGYRPENIYVSYKQLPVGLRRVAVLPPTCDSTKSDLVAGVDSLTAVITEELGKTKKFELVFVTPEQLRAWTGRSSWQAEETLPARLLENLHDQLDCDAVLFSRLTQYRAYPPLAVGFSFKLAEVEQAELVWVADEIFDASEPSVVNSARRYQLTREHLPSSLSDSRSILNSPSGFGRYAASSIFQTLPVR